ncbi:hypothetical protein HY78_19355 [Rhizorhabdus wittichii DC-6]|uniref:Alcohol dehydrogenase catalytic domain-containing protein n=1 Tax=Rhizorhabdus wittichii TaxID=160791 RepID=A0A975D2W4_9SPHN|nr:alcohol dehydrogenase family protein [Rhizorhabdus wittichii]ARR55442.1 hypothetical protein HY78_19355 [Rhizorhabdus wittichii DC-6]QTH21664.1 alcohol dehydrogenase catalytic domain-containing protein [Rhizorhabdus wittichii]
MKALIHLGPGRIGYESVPDPILPDRQGALVRTTMCGLCGSDLHLYHGAPAHGSYCIGHEAVGEVVEVGSEVRDFRVGDRVLLPAILGCGRCDPCRAGDVYLCRTQSAPMIYGQGFPGIGGSQAEAVAVPNADRNLWRLPPGLSDEVGIMLTDNLATAWFCARRARVRPGDVVAVIGLGPVGQQAVMAAKAMGAERVLGIDLLQSRRAAAALLGAEPIEAADVVQAAIELTGGDGPDVVLDANGSAVTIGLAIGMVRKGGRVSVVGLSESPQIDFPIIGSMLKNLDFHIGVCSVQAELPALFGAIEAGRIDTGALEALVTHRMGLSEGAEGYARFDAREGGIGKVVFDPTR